MKRLSPHAVASVLSALLLVACYHIDPHHPAPAAQASLKTLKAKGAPRMAVGTVQAVGRAALYESGIGCRAYLRVKPPEKTPTFSAYIREALIDELVAADLYDSGSKIVITADLSNVDFDSGGEGTVEMNVAFTVSGGTKRVTLDRDMKEKFNAGFMAWTACANTTEAFPNLLEHVISGFWSSQDVARAVLPAASASAGAAASGVSAAGSTSAASARIASSGAPATSVAPAASVGPVAAAASGSAPSKGAAPKDVNR